MPDPRSSCPISSPFGYISAVRPPDRSLPEPPTRAAIQVASHRRWGLPVDRPPRNDRAPDEQVLGLGYRLSSNHTRFGSFLITPHRSDNCVTSRRPQPPIRSGEGSEGPTDRNLGPRPPPRRGPAAPRHPPPPDRVPRAKPACRTALRHDLAREQPEVLYPLLREANLTSARATNSRAMAGGPGFYGDSTRPAWLLLWGFGGLFKRSRGSYHFPATHKDATVTIGPAHAGGDHGELRGTSRAAVRGAGGPPRRGAWTSPLSTRSTRLLTSAQSDGYRGVRIDLRGLEFIDSTGIRLLLMAHQRAEQRGDEFCIIRGSERIQRVFALTDLDGRLPFCDDGP